MPFKSEAQRRKFYAMAARGEIDKDTVKEWESETPKKKKLPERVSKEKKAFIDCFVRSLYKSLPMSKEAAALTPEGQALVKLATVIMPLTLPEELQAVGASALGPYAVGVPLGHYAASLFRPEAMEINNLRKRETIMALDEATQDVRARMALRAAKLKAKGKA